MPAEQTIHLYCLCWNDARMLPYFFRHYDPVVDRYIVYDNGSTDGSLELLAAHEKVRLEHFDTPGDSFVEEERRLSDIIWQESRGAADWVIVLDIDEHIVHPELAQYLIACREAGVTAVRGIGYEMIADSFPEADRSLCESVTIGARSAGHDKLCIFNPDAVTHSGFGPGRHTAAPEGRIRWPDRPEILLLHYKQLGVEYPIHRSAELRRGLKEGDIAQGWGRQYLWSAAEIAEKWAKLRMAAAPVPGLGTLSHVEPAYYDEEYVVAESGLFDAEWYAGAYPDITAAGANALSHFCIHGWREGRKPNFYFDPQWYLANNAELREDGHNPLIHYIRSGERDNLPPSPYFDPGWYRVHHGLEEFDSPLCHYLENRAGEAVSPNPDFDVAAYCRDNPVLAGEQRDPFEEYHGRTVAPPPAAKPDARLPAYDDVIAALGLDPRRAAAETAVEISAVLGLISLFVGGCHVDETRYRRAYPDVATAIDEGAVSSAREHFIEFGYFEGRNPCPEEVDEG